MWDISLDSVALSHFLSVWISFEAVFISSVQRLRRCCAGA